jgi:pilus assembly protein FimV
MVFNFLSRHDSATSSVAPSTRTVERTPTSAEQIAALSHRVEGLTAQSALNQELCQQLSADLVAKETEHAQQATLISGLQDLVRKSDDKHSSQIALLQQVVAGLSGESSAKQQASSSLERRLSLARSVATRHENTAAEYRSMAEQLDEFWSAKCQQLEEENSIFRASHSEQVSQIEMLHSSLQVSLASQQASHQSQLEVLQSAHETALAELTTDFQSKLSTVRAAHDAELIS